MVNRAGVAREWQHYWDGLIFAVPLWEGSGLGVQDVAGGIFSNESGSTGGEWVETSHGLAYSTLVTAGRLQFDEVAFPRGDAEMTLFVGGIMSRAGQQTLNIISFGADAFGTDYTLDISYSGTDDYRFNNAVPDVLTWPSEEDGLFHTVGISRQIGGATRFISDGVFQAEDVGAATFPDTNQDTLLIGGSSQTDSTGDDLATLVAYVWDRVLSDDNLIKLHQDPFGPIRPDPLPITLIESLLDVPGPLPYRTIQNRRRTTVRM